MEPVRSSLYGGGVATVVLLVFLLVADFLLSGTNLFVFATFTGLCTVGGPPYCELESFTATAMTGVVVIALFAVAWPLLFAGFTWGLPGESGFTHGVVFGVVLWLGYAATGWIGLGSLRASVPIMATMLVGYLVYGIVLGSVYDRLAEHRTLLDVDSE
jgi:hypothetical protein